MSGAFASGTSPVRSHNRTVAAWDLPTRLFKWTFVLAVASAWLMQWLGDAWLRWHVWNGYAVLVLLVFRLIWGFAGSSTSRFSAWVRWPWTALGYGYALLRGRGRPYLGHNPLGSWMIIALLAIVASQAFAGLFTVDSNGLVGGPFANLDFGDPTPVQSALSRYHHGAFRLILVFATVHIAVNLFYQFVKRDPVVAAMIVGRKPVEPFADEEEMTAPPHLAWRALASLAAAVAIVLGTIKVLGGALS